MSQFQIAITADMFGTDGKPRYPDIGLSLLEERKLAVSYAPFETHQPEIAPGQLAGVQGCVVLTPKVTAASLSQADELLVLGRFGVGYDTVDVAACTEANVAAFITAGAVDRSVAEATLGWMIALGHRTLVKDRLVRTGDWDARSSHMGLELRDRTLGLIGCGGIAQALVELLKGFGMRQPLVFDPFLNETKAAELGVKSCGLDTVMAEADFISIHCPLTPETRGLIGREELARMKSSAFLLNTARGGIVQEDPLFEALKTGAIGGAALDCFEEEPVTSPHRFGELDNVILAPHSIAWTEELFRDIGRAVCRGILEVGAGRKPPGLLNPEVFDQPGFQEKLKRHRLI